MSAVGLAGAGERGRREERENALEARDEEELVELVDVDALRRERAFHVVVVVNTGARRDGGVGEIGRAHV